MNRILKFIRTIPCPKLDLFCDVGLFSIRTVTCGREAYRACFTYQRYDITVWGEKWHFSFALYNPDEYRHRYRCEEFLRSIQHLKKIWLEADRTPLPDFKPGCPENVNHFREKFLELGECLYVAERRFTE